MKRKVKTDYLERIDGADHLVANMSTIFRSHVHYNETELQRDIERDYRENSNIYMLCTRQKARFLRGSVREMADHTGLRSVAGLLSVYEHGETKRVPFQADLTLIASEVLGRGGLSESDVARGYVRVVETANDSFVRLVAFGVLQNGKKYEFTEDVELDFFSRYFQWYIPEVQDLKVEYIGKSTGTLNESNSPKRLSNHTQRTALTSEALMRGDVDVIALYLNYDAVLSDGRKSQAIDMPRPNMISLIEGGLIHHFLPRLNTEGVKHFPHHKPLRNQVVHLGIQEMNVTVNADDCSFRIYSNTIKPTVFAVTSHTFNETGLGEVDRSNSSAVRFPANPQNTIRQLHFLETKKTEIALISGVLLQGEKPTFLHSIKRLLPFRNKPVIGHPALRINDKADGLSQSSEDVIQSLKQSVSPALRQCAGSVKLLLKGYQPDRPLFDHARNYLHDLHIALDGVHPEANALLQIALGDVCREHKLTLNSSELELLPPIVRGAVENKIPRMNADNFLTNVSILHPDVGIKDSIVEVSSAFANQWTSLKEAYAYVQVSPGPKPRNDNAVEPSKSLDLIEDHGYGGQKYKGPRR